MKLSNVELETIQRALVDQPPTPEVLNLHGRVSRLLAVRLEKEEELKYGPYCRQHDFFSCPYCH